MNAWKGLASLLAFFGLAQRSISSGVDEIYFGPGPDVWAWSWTRLKRSWLQLTVGESLVFAACFEEAPENPLKGSGKRSLVRHKVVELLTLLRSINAVVPDTFFFYTSYPHPPSSSLPPSSGIHQVALGGGEEPNNVGKSERDAFHTSETPLSKGSGACFCSSVESFTNHSNRVLLAALKPTPPFLEHAAVHCCCCFSSSTRGHMGKVFYHTH